MDRCKLYWRIKLTELANKMDTGGGRAGGDGGGEGKVKDPQRTHSQPGSRPSNVSNHSKPSVVAGERPQT